MVSKLEKGCISLSFDDGREDSYTIAYPLLKTYNIPATFNITTGYVLKKGGNPTDVPAMTEQMVQEMFNCPLFEIAGHGYYHRNDIEDISRGISGLKEMLHVEMLTPDGDGFASPGTGLQREIWSKLGEGEQDIKYARVSLRYLGHPRLKTFVRKASRLLRWPILYRIAYQDTMMNSIKDGLLYSVPVLSSITNDELESLVEYASTHKQALVLMFHSIVPKERMHDNWDFEDAKFKNLLLFLNGMRAKGKLDILTSMELTKKLK